MKQPIAREKAELDNTYRIVAGRSLHFDKSNL